MAKNNPVKIIFDTNWFISHIITGRPEILDKILIDDDYEIILSDKQEEEFEKVITYPKHRRYFTVDIAKRYFGFIKQRSLYYTPAKLITSCRDPKDNYLLDLAKVSNADYLITGDLDLLALKQFENTIICTLPEFIKNHYKK